MALILEITKADGSVARTTLQNQATKVAAWPGGKVRVIDSATGKSPAGITAKKVGDSLVVDGLPEGKTVEVTKFYTDCSPASPCSVVIDPADGAAPVSITQTSQPVAALPDNQSLMYGPTSSAAAAAPATAAASGGVPTGAIVGGLALLGIAAAAGGGGGGGGSSTPPPDTTAPNAPVIANVAGDNVVDTAEAAAGVAVSGTAEAGSTVTVTWGSTTKTATADGSGAWSVNFASGEVPADGNTTISATARDAAGNTSNAGTRAVVVDTSAPSEPTVAIVAADDVVDAAEAAAGVAVSGTAEAGSTVEVTWGSTTKTTSADGSGAWSVNFASGEVPAAGNTTISATARDAAGNTSAAGTRPVLVDTVDTTAPNAPVIANVAGDNVVNAAEATAGVAVSGTAEAGSTVEVTWGSTTKTTSADGSGAWSVNFASGEVPADGATQISATATDASSNTSAAATRDVEIDKTAPVAPTALAGLDGSVSGTAEANSTVKLGAAETSADGSGNYQFAAGTLASGATASVTATDAAGNASTGTDVTAPILVIGGDQAEILGSAGNDVLIGGTGGSVRNYQFEYWNTSGADAFLAGDQDYAAFASTAANGWTIGTDATSVFADPGGANVQQFTGGPMEIVSNLLDSDPNWPDDTGGGGRYYWETVFDNGTGGASLSQAIYTKPGQLYALAIQMNGFDGDTTLSIWWNGVEIWNRDGLTDSYAGSLIEPTIYPVDSPNDSRQYWVWSVEGAAGSTTTELEIRSYEALDDGLGRRIDRVMLDPITDPVDRIVTPDGAETMAGGAGSDLLYGQAGDDTLYGGAVGDTAATADGVADGFVYTMRVGNGNHNGNDVIKDFQVGFDRIFLVDSLDGYSTDSRNPGAVDDGTTTTNADTNLSYRDFVQADSPLQYLTVENDGSGSVKLGFWGTSNLGVATELGSVVLEGVAFGTEAGQYDTVQDLFTGGIVSATMDGFHAGLLQTV